MKLMTNKQALRMNTELINKEVKKEMFRLLLSSMRKRDVVLLKYKQVSESNGFFTTIYQTDNDIMRFLPENEVGNVEYKWKLITPSVSRLQHLSTQMKWRLREGHGEALYRIGVKDDGSAVGLSDSDMVESLISLFKIASLVGASIEVLNKRIVGNVKTNSDIVEERQIANVWIRKMSPNRNFVDLRIAFLGSAEVGKSTLCGVLTQGELDNGQGKTRLNLFRHLHEFRTGKTSSVCLDFVGFSADGKLINYGENSLEEIIERAVKIVTLIDLAGDRRYLKTTIYGVCGFNPHYCAVLVNAVTGITSVTKEHIGLIMALGIPFFIVVSKIDLVSKFHNEKLLTNIERFVKKLNESLTPVRVTLEVDAAFCAASITSSVINNVVPILLISSVTGDNMDLLQRFLGALPQYNLKFCNSLTLKSVSSKNCNAPDSFLPNNVSSLFYIDELFQIKNLGMVVCGYLAEGVIQEAKEIQIGPYKFGRYFKGVVQSIHRNKQPVYKVCAGERAALHILFRVVAQRRLSKGNENALLQTKLYKVQKGMIIIGVNDACVSCRQFVAKFYLLHHPTKSKELFIGFQGTVFIGSLCRTVVIMKIEGVKSIHINEWVIVTFKFLQQVEFVRVGMPLIFREHHTKGMGEVLELILNF